MSRVAATVLLATLAAGCKSDDRDEAPAAPDPEPPAEEPAPTPRPIPTPAADGAMAPNLAADGDGVLASWIEPAPGEDTAVRVRVARFDGASWSEPVTVAAGEDIVANWADVPSVVRGPDGALVAHWPQSSGDSPYAYDVRLARAADGRAFEPIGTAHDDGTATEHGFVSLFAAGSGVGAVWLDGREMAGPHRGAMTLRTTRVGEEVGQGAVLDARVCDCCGTAVATAADGPVVFYRNRSDDEVRDVWTVRRTDAGWTEPAPVHEDGWTIAGCPVNGPAADADGDRIAVAWYTYAGGTPRVKVAFSGDGGLGFSEPVEVDAPRGRRAPIGRVDLVLAGDEAVVSWLASDRDRAELLLRRVGAGGERGATLTVGETAAARAGGFPRLAPLGDELLALWTETGETTRLRARLVPLAAVPALDTDDAPPAAVAEQLTPGDPAPDYAGTDLRGHDVTLAEIDGPVLLNVWATWCEPCRHELPELAALHERHADDGLAIVAVNVDGSDAGARVRRFVERRELPFAIWRDPDDRISRTLGIGTLPATFVFDRSGQLVWRREGALTADDPELGRALERITSATEDRASRSR